MYIGILNIANPGGRVF